MSTNIGRFRKSPIEKKRYTVDYSAWLSAGEVVGSVGLTISPASTPPLVASGAFVDGTGLFLTFYLAQGQNGQTYRVSVVIQTNQSQTKEDILVMQVQDA